MKTYLLAIYIIKNTQKTTYILCIIFIQMSKGKINKLLIIKIFH